MLTILKKFPQSDMRSLFIIMTLLVALIIIISFIVVFLIIHDNIALSRQENDSQKSSWYTWQFFGFTFLIKNKFVCALIAILALVAIILAYAYLGFQFSL